MEKKSLLMIILFILAIVSLILSIYSIYLSHLNRDYIDEERDSSIERTLILSDIVNVSFMAVRDRFVLIENKLNITRSELAKR